MVVHQGTILDRIDHNMEQAVDYMKDANKELEIAETYQKNALPKKCIGCLVTLIIIMIVIMAAKHSGN
jgi:syntaxin 16